MLAAITKRSAVQITRRYFSATNLLMTNQRAIYYESHGDPSKVLSVMTLPALAEPSGSAVNLKVLLSPINPSDINVVQGVYPLKPEPTKLANGVTIHIPGNEALAQVEKIGPDVQGLVKGDWVIFAKKQAGTWSSGLTVNETDVVKVDKVDGFTDVHAATLAVNPATALNMLRDFVDLKPGDWVLQNGANSAVGQAVIQIAVSRGLNTLNFIRDRKDLDAMKEYLTGLGATKVLTYDELDDKSLKTRVSEWTGGKEINLLLNGVGDKITTKMLRLLGNEAQVVTYGAMSKAALPVPPGALIFQDIIFRGFWQSRWYAKKSIQERSAMTQELVKLMSEGKLKEPAHEIITINGNEDDVAASKTIQDIMAKVTDGTYGKKVLLRINPVDVKDMV